MRADEFSQRLLRDCALPPGSHVLVALSGGADSVAMLCLFLEIAGDYPLTLSCAHVEHGIRGEASAQDCAFVHALCKEKSVPLYVVHVDAPAYSREHGCGLEDAARRLRHAFLQKTADSIGADAIALAHHAADQQETVLLHAMRGSDIKGMCAMRWRSGRLIRPLLEESPETLRDYLSDLGQTWREDESNADTAYLRNRIRHEILPRMEKAVPGAGRALMRLARAAQRDEDYFGAKLDELDLGVVSLVDGIAVKREKLRRLHPALLSRALVRLMNRAGISAAGADGIEAVMDALESGGETVNLPGGAHAQVGEAYLCLVRPGNTAAAVKLNVPGITDTPFGRFDIRSESEGETGDGKRTQCMPLARLQGAYVCARREGDVMIPFGKHTPVKLKKLMIDAHVERAMRNSVPIVRSKQGKVLWAVGLRPDESCRRAAMDTQMIVRFCGEWPCADEE